jgi:hypothetical protein
MKQTLNVNCEVTSNVPTGMLKDIMDEVYGELGE